MTGTIRNLFGDSTAESHDAINEDMSARLRDLADKAERGEVAAIFCVTLSPALGVDTEWLGHMGTGLSLRGAIAAGVTNYDSNEL